MISIIIFLFSIIPSYDIHAHSSRNLLEKKAIPLTEDLMYEHGLLNRVLLIYEDIIKKINTHKSFPLSILQEAVMIIKNFIENYHETIEENYIFPLFEKNNKEIRLIKTLKEQHNKGREITKQLQNILSHQTSLNNKSKKRIKTLLQKFIKMYRPHEARENTILFPQIRELMNQKEFEDLGETFEAIEQQLFGQHGFENMIKKVETLEKQLNIYQLDLFTPKI